MYRVWVPDVKAPSEWRQHSARQGTVCAERDDASPVIVIIVHPKRVFSMIIINTCDPQTHENTLLLRFLQKKKRKLVETS